jgi:hypothetical protein
MRSQTTSRFWKSYKTLPISVQEKAHKAFKLWSENPDHPSLHFKKIHASNPIYSVRINLQYRALGVKDGNTGLVLDWNS